jgi:hypothetical protein
MNLHLAGEHPVKNGTQCKTWKGCNILESFYYVSKNIHFERLYTQCEHFLLDSGAFTFLIGNHKKTIDWGEYTQNLDKITQILLIIGSPVSNKRKGSFQWIEARLPMVRNKVSKV